MNRHHLGSHGKVDLRVERIAGRVHRGRTWGARLGSTGRRRVRVHHRSHAVRRHVPVWAADVRDDGRVGDRLRPGCAVGPHGPLRHRLASGGQGRLFLDPGHDVHGQNPSRTALRAEGGAGPEGRRHGDLIVGGPNLAAQTLRAGLVDELQLLVWPVVLGGRIRHCLPTSAADLSSSASTDSETASYIFATSCDEPATDARASALQALSCADPVCASLNGGGRPRLR